MRASDIREQTTEELETRLNDIKKNLFNLKFQKAIGQLDNTQAIRNLRKDVAVVETLIREKQLGINKEIKAERPAVRGKSSTRKKASGNKAPRKESKKKKVESKNS